MLNSILFLGAVIGYLALSNDGILQGHFSSIRLFGSIITSLLTWFNDNPIVQITNNHFSQTNIFFPKQKVEEKPCKQKKRQKPKSSKSNPRRKKHRKRLR